MSSSWGLATVIKVEELKTESVNGRLISHKYTDVGYETQAIFLEDGTVLNSAIDERRNRSGMPVEYMGCTAKSVDWSKYDPENTEPQKRIINAFVVKFKEFQREGRGLYFCSATKGSGKTMIACALANEVLKTNDISVKFINVSDYIELIKAKDNGSRERVESILDAGLLILDDIGAQVEDKDWITAALFRLIGTRYANHHSTIFTSNVRMENLKIDQRIADRIYAVSVPVMMPEVNVRKELADKATRKFLRSVLSEE